MYGQLLIDSMPPATATAMSPVRMPWSASITAFKPDPQTLFTVSAATWSGSPPRSAAWRAGFCPSPAETTLPMMHSSTMPGSIAARRTASPTTSAPSCVADRDFSAPRNLPVGVRTAETMTVSGTFAYRDRRHRAVAEQSLEAIEDDGRRAPHLARPLVACGVDNQRARFEAHRRLPRQRGPDRGAPRERHFARRERRVPQKFGERAGQRGIERPHGIDPIIQWSA